MNNSILKTSEKTLNIYEALRQDHDTQRSLVDLLIKTQGDSSERTQIYEMLKTELKSHAAAEERFLYVPLIAHDMTQEKSRHSIAEHHDMDEMMEALDDTDLSSSAWLVEAKKLHHRVHHHLDEEEQEVFQLSGKVLSDAEKSSLGEEYLNEMTELRKKSW